MLESVIYMAMLDEIECTIKDRNGHLRFLTLVEPTIKDLYVASLKYEESLQNCLDEDLFDDDEYLEFLVKEGLWTKKENDELREIPNGIEELKVKLAGCTFKSNSRKLIKNELKQNRKKLEKLSDKFHKYDYLSAKGIASMAKIYYLITCSTKEKDSAYDLSCDEPNILLDSIINYKNKIRLSENQLRQIARSEIWNGYWRCGEPFGKPTIQLTENQRNLILITRMYDNIKESYEPPASWVIDDDDALDGWLILQRRKRQGEQDRAEVEGKLGDKMSKHENLFIPAETYEDITKIRDMNTQQAQIKKMQKLNELNKNNENFSDSKSKAVNLMKG